jgi:hypothetical protein
LVGNSGEVSLEFGRGTAGKGCRLTRTRIAAEVWAEERPAVSGEEEAAARPPRLQFRCDGDQGGATSDASSSGGVQVRL